MKILYLVKSYPSREYEICNELMKKFDNLIVDAAAFSMRTFLDLEDINKNKVFEKIYNFTKFYQDNYKSFKEVDYYLFNYDVNYRLPINEILFADRTIIDYDETKRKSLIYSLIVFAEGLIKKKEYDVVIGELSSSSDLIFYYLCKFYNIEFLFMWDGRIKNKIEFGDIDGNRKGLNELYRYYKKNKLNEEEENQINEYLIHFNKKMTPHYMEFTDQTKIKSVYKKDYKENVIKRLYKYIISYKVDINYSADMPANICYKIKPRLNKIKFPFKKILGNTYYENVNLKNKYYLLPLHYQPEASTLTFATYYLNQVAFIENISKAIPGGCYLYIKEHPAMYLDRKVNFYKKIKKIPNVKVVGPNQGMQELIKKSQGVITLTNTTGYEAIVFDRPVFVFGNVFYQAYDYCYKCESYRDFKIKVREALYIWGNENEKEARDKDRKYFILSCINSLKDGNLDGPINDRDLSFKNNLKKLTSSIYEFLNEGGELENDVKD